VPSAPWQKQMAPSASPRTPIRLRAAAARVARLKALQQRTPPTHNLFGLVCLLFRAALMIQLVVAGVEQLRLLAALARTDYYYEDGLPPRPFTFEELTRKHHSKFKEWFRIDTPKCVCLQPLSCSVDPRPITLINVFMAPTLMNIVISYPPQSFHHHSWVKELAKKLGLPELIERPPGSRRPPVDRNLALLAVLAFLSGPLRKQEQLPHLFGRDRRDIGQ
jgi:hypothetical protein